MRSRSFTLVVPSTHGARITNVSVFGMNVRLSSHHRGLADGDQGNAEAEGDLP